MSTVVPSTLMEAAMQIKLSEQKLQRATGSPPLLPRKKPKVQHLSLVTAPTQTQEEEFGPKKASGDKGRAGQKKSISGRCLQARARAVLAEKQEQLQGNLPALPHPLSGLEASGRDGRR